MQAEAPLSEKTAARRQDLEKKRGPLSGPLLGQHEEGSIAVAMGERWPIPSMQLWDDLYSPPQEVLCELREIFKQHHVASENPDSPSQSPKPQAP